MYRKPHIGAPKNTHFLKIKNNSLQLARAVFCLDNSGSLGKSREK
jgi:hypothetical protein